MKTVLEALTRKQEEFSEHPFFLRMRRGGSIDDVIAFVPGLVFWPMVFQDVLRLNEKRVADPALRGIVVRHRQEDLGHHEWLLHDMEVLGIEYDLRDLFSAAHANTRDAVYAIMAETFHADSDYARVATILVLEATGAEFFTAVARFVESVGATQDLKYLSRHHLQVEQEHEIWENEVRQQLSAAVLLQGEREQVMRLVERLFAALTEIMSHLEALATRNSEERTHVPSNNAAASG